MGCKPLFGVAKVVVDHSVTTAAGCGHLPVLLNNPNPPQTSPFTQAMDAIFHQANCLAVV